MSDRATDPLLATAALIQQWRAMPEAARAGTGAVFQAHMEVVMRLFAEAAEAYFDRCAAKHPPPKCKHGHALRDRMGAETPCPQGCKFTAVHFDVSDLAPVDFPREAAEAVVAGWLAKHGNMLTSGADELEDSIAQVVAQTQQLCGRCFSFVREERIDG